MDLKEGTLLYRNTGEEVCIKSVGSIYYTMENREVISISTLFPVGHSEYHYTTIKPILSNLKVTKVELLELGFKEEVVDEIYFIPLVKTNDLMEYGVPVYIYVQLDKEIQQCSVDLYDGNEDFLCELKEGLPTKANLIILINALKGI